MAQRVDKLEFLVLVDNSEFTSAAISLLFLHHLSTLYPDRVRLTLGIERLQRLPPGFSHELPQHLHHHLNPVDELTGLPLTRFEDFCCGAHGLSILIVSYMVPHGKLTETEDDDRR